MRSTETPVLVLYGLAVIFGWILPMIIAPMVGQSRTIGGGPAFGLALFLSWFGVVIVSCFPKKPIRPWR